MNNFFKDILLILSLIIKNIIYKRSQSNNDYVLVTAIDDTHFIYLENLLENYKKSKNTFNKFVIYGLNLSKDLKLKINELDFVDFREFDFKNYPPHFSLRLKEHNNKIGGFAWKPAIILELFNEQKYQNVIWLDSACLFDYKLYLFKLLIKNRGFASFHSKGNINDWTFDSVLKFNNISEKDTIFKSKNLMAGVLGFNFKNKKAINLLNSWNQLSLNPSNIFPEGSTVNNHRHDQSLLSICYWKIYSNNLPNNTKLFGIRIQNWPNKILYFFDENKNFRKILLEKYLFYTTTTNSRCEIVILFKPESLKYIPFRLLLSKKVLLFISSELEIQKLYQYKFKRYFIHIYTDMDTNLKKAKKINYDISEIDKIIYKEYLKKINV